MRSRRSAWRWLLEKEWRELVASRSWWLMLLLMGPLVGVSFIGAVRTYGEASGLNGTAAGVGEAFSPLIGIWAPTFSACEIAAVFLLPFVAIRLVSGDRQSGALKIELQHAMAPSTRVAAKALVLIAAWLIACAAPAMAVVMWKAYGGTVYVPELVTVLLGHVLNAALTIALAAAAAAIADHPATAAIITLSVTVGTWIINFVAAVQGGIWEAAAGYTPTAMVAAFQHGLVRGDVVLTALVLTCAGLGLATIWIRIGVAVRKRVRESLALGALAAVTLFACTLVTPSWDTSENRANSFPRADEEALQRIRQPLRIEVHLAPQDPRRSDLEHNALAKLRRTLPRLDVTDISSSSIGLMEQSSESYGEIRYELDGRRTVSRATTVEGVLEAIYAVSALTPRAEREDEVFRGHPLAVTPRGAGIVFYGAWPIAVIGAGTLARRRIG